MYLITADITYILKFSVLESRLKCVSEILRVLRICDVNTDHVPHPSIPKHMRMVTQNWKKKMKKNTKKLKELSLLQRKITSLRLYITQFALHSLGLGYAFVSLLCLFTYKFIAYDLAIN